jgi:hypothetical protein
MRKFSIHVLVGFLLLITHGVCSQDLNVDEDVPNPRFEVGGQFTYLHRKDADTSFETFKRFGFVNPDVESARLREFGLGGRFTFNATTNIAFETEFNFYPVDKQTIPVVGVPISVIEPGGRKSQLLIGAKMGKRMKKFGVFGKVRPGIIWLDRYRAVIAVGTPENFFVTERRRNVGFFNIDIGGVLEYYPSRRTVFRVDVGDTIIHYRKLPPKEINPSITRHNLQISTGFGFRF